VFAHGPTPFVSVLAAPAEEHQPEEHLPGPVQGCHHLGFGRGSGQDAAPGHGAAAKEDSVAPVALRGGAAAVSEVSRPEYLLHLYTSHLNSFQGAAGPTAHHRGDG